MLKSNSSVLKFGLGVLVLLATSNSALAVEEVVAATPALKPMYIGHNLSPSTEQMTARSWTVGTYLIAYAPTDSCLFGMNPWITWNYNSYNVVGRCRLMNQTKWFEEMNLQGAYLQSDHSLGDAYRQRVGILWWTVKHTFTDYYTLYTTLNFMHFWDETIPFSLRRDPGNDQPYQFSLTTLHRVRWTETLGFAFEFGALGLNYHTPLVHNGYSLVKTGKNYLAQAGFSMSAVPNDVDRLNSRTLTRRQGPGYDFTLHPELQLQYYF